MGNIISNKRYNCIKLFEISQLKTDQIAIVLNINNLKNQQIPIDTTKIPNFKTRLEFTKAAIKYIKTCDEETLDKINEYLINLNSENDITGGSVHV